MEFALPRRFQNPTVQQSLPISTSKDSPFRLYHLLLHLIS